MTDHDIATLIREHISRDEPPFLLSPGAPIALGRRTLLRRRARRGLAGVLVAAAMAAPLVPWNGSTGSRDDGHGVDATTVRTPAQYDGRRMPGVLEDQVRTALGHGLDGLGGTTFVAFDDRDKILPPRLYDKASGMSLGFGGRGDHRLEVTLRYAHSTTPADPQTTCSSDLASGIDVNCVVATGPGGEPVTTTVSAARPAAGGDWEVVHSDELRTGFTRADGLDGRHPLDRSQVYFFRTVEAARSTRLLVSAQEVVRAPDAAAAETLWQFPAADLEKLVTDPELVIPRPGR